MVYSYWILNIHEQAGLRFLNNKTKKIWQIYILFGVSCRLWMLPVESMESWKDRKNNSAKSDQSKKLIIDRKTFPERCNFIFNQMFLLHSSWAMAISTVKRGSENFKGLLFSHHLSLLTNIWLLNFPFDLDIWNDIKYKYLPP